MGTTTARDALNRPLKEGDWVVTNTYGAVGHKTIALVTVAKVLANGNQIVKVLIPEITIWSKHLKTLPEHLYDYMHGNVNPDVCLRVMKRDIHNLIKLEVTDTLLNELNAANSHILSLDYDRVKEIYS
jgi:hypothetical protein